jgi:hypothetical protein
VFVAFDEANAMGPDVNVVVERGLEDVSTSGMAPGVPCFPLRERVGKPGEMLGFVFDVEKAEVGEGVQEVPEECVECSGVAKGACPFGNRALRSGWR